jgi:predicted AlkP superfamily phosphohydrolase/phosphomutase
MEQGNLPHLSALEQQGTSGVLRSTLPAITSAAWSAFITGNEPSNTGVFSFYYRDRGSYAIRTYTRLQVRGTSLWRQLSRYGKRSIVINVPMTYPAEDINGFIITGFPTPSTASTEFTAPKDLFERFRLHRDQYPIRIRLPDYEGRYADLITDLKKMVREHFRVAEVLIREPWDLFMVHFLATDLAQHALWRFIDPGHPQYDEGNARKYGHGLLEVFTEVDSKIGELLKRVDQDQTTVFVLSDHGFGPNHFTIHINRWLQKIGMMNLHPPLTYFSSQLSNMLLLKAGLPPQGIAGQLLNLVTSSSGYLFPRVWQERIGHSIKRHLKRLPIRSARFDLRGYGPMFKAVDWRRTRAYSVGTSGLIYMNVQGREPQGIVSPGKEYEEVRDFILNGLLNLTDGRGCKVINRVYRKEEIYHGEFLSEAPDLIPVSESVGCYFYPFLNREGIITEAEGFRSGNHRIDGILIAKGPPVKKNWRSERTQIIDMAPTLLYLLDAPLPVITDGSVMEQIFEPTYLEKHPVLRSEESEIPVGYRTVSTADEDQIAKKLEDLGYL